LQRENTGTRLSRDEREQHIDAAAKWIERGFYSDVMTELEEDTEIAEKIESPLEEVFWIWWQAVRHVSDVKLDAIPQKEVTIDGEMFRLDFAVCADSDELWEGHRHGLSWPKLAIELDGHDWHERTPEQVARRDHRDRVLQTDGWKIFHFSGREFLGQPLARVSQLYADIAELYWAWKKDGEKAR